MKNVYTIVNGILKTSEIEFKLSFALIFLKDGIYTIDAFVAEPNFYNTNIHSHEYTLIGITEKGYDIEVFSLSCTMYKSHSNKISLKCNGHIRLIDKRNNKFDENAQVKTQSDNIYMIEIEGLKMHFADHTTHEKHRLDGQVQDELLNVEFDHTSCGLIVNDPSKIRGGNYFNLFFIKSQLNNNIILDFRKGEAGNKLSLSNYKIIKNDLICFLSFVNGGKILVRRELCGSFFTERRGGEFDSQDVVLYSKPEMSESFCSDYVPINYHHSYSSEIFDQLFIRCFDKYYQLNKTLDFNSLVFSLNNSYATKGLKERYFILITAFERICNNYAKQNNISSELVDQEYFHNEIKPRLLKIISDCEIDIRKNNPIAMEVFTSRLRNLNQRVDTVQKLYEFIDYCKIPINDNVRKLIDVERHKAVHEGVIGESDVEMVQNYWKLDHILRDAILNLIGYRSHRSRKFDYDKTSNL
jgi:hypothetical protein